ncbi:hypothetical protein [Haloechinothrix halophila]|nr:hypothetical protein [Haloechinothrix halophila]
MMTTRWKSVLRACAALAASGLLLTACPDSGGTDGGGGYAPQSAQVIGR